MVRSEQNSDLRLLSLATTALFVEVLYLFWLLRIVEIPLPSYFRQVIGPTSTADTVGTLVEKRLAVRNRSQSSLTWLPMASGDGVHPRDTVMTGMGASAVVQLADGSRLELGPDSLIHFPAAAPGAAFVELELNRGKVRLWSGGQKRRVRLRTRSIDVNPSSEVVVTAEPMSSKATIELVHGEATIPAETTEALPTTSDTPAAPLTAITVKAGDSLQVSATGSVKVGPTLLAASPLTPSAGVKLFSRTIPSMLSFSWKGESARYMELSTFENFSNSRKIPTTGEHSAEASVGAGKYYWRLVGGEAKQERHSTGFSFEVIEFPRYAPKAPDHAMLKESRQVQLRWKAIPLAEKYEIEIARDRDFKKVIFTRQVSQPSADWTSDAAGEFFWRVTASTAGIDRWPSSDVQTFRVRPQIAAPKPKGAKVLNLNKKPEKPTSKSPHGLRMKAFLFFVLLLTPEAFAEERLKMEFNWEKVPGAKRYLLQVSTTPKFGKKPFEIQVDETRALVDLRPSPEYFWRVAGIDEDGDLGKFSETQRMDAKAALTPPKPVVAEVKAPPREPASRKGIPEEPIPPTEVTQVKLGYGGGWALQRGSSGPSDIRSSGLAWNSVRGAMQLQRGTWTADLTAGFQPWKYRSDNPAIADFQPNLSVNRWDASLLVRRKLDPWYGGLRFRLEGELQKLGAETVRIDPLTYWAAVVGKRWALSESALVDTSNGWSISTQFELAPIGARKGLSAELKSSYGLGQFFENWVPVWEVSLYPYYRHHSITGRPEWTVEWSTWLWFAWKADALPTELLPRKNKTIW